MGTRLPKRVEEQGKRAEELIKKIQAGQDPSAVPPAVNTPPAPATPEPPVIPPVTPPTVTPASPATVAPVTPEPPAIPPAPVTPSPAPDDPNSETWKSRYTVLQGKYDAEVPRYAYRVQYLENQIADLIGQIKALRVATPVTPGTPTPATPPVATTTFISDSMKDNPEFKAFKENFPDIADMMVKVVDTAATKIHQDTAQRFTALESNSVQDRQEKFVAVLNAKYPGWQTMGQDPNWALWLGQKDRYSPKKRLDLLKEANQSLDAEAVTNLLDDFKADMAKAGNPPAFVPSTPATPTPPAVPFVTPPSGSGSAPANLNANQGPETVTRSFINQFYQDKIRGRYKGREEEVAKIQAKIDAAVSAGKILNK